MVRLDATPPDLAADVSQELARFPDMVAYLEQHLGAYPFVAAGNVVVPGMPPTALETQTRSVLSLAALVLCRDLAGFAWTAGLLGGLWTAAAFALLWNAARPGFWAALSVGAALGHFDGGDFSRELTRLLGLEGLQVRLQRELVLRLFKVGELKGCRRMNRQADALPQATWNGALYGAGGVAPFLRRGCTRVGGSVLLAFHGSL